MDPLSIAAGVVGLLSAAITISTTLGEIIQRTRKAPEECRNARREVDDIRHVLSQLQLFVLGASRASKSRTSLILVEQVVATLASSVTTFSDLDVFVETLNSDDELGLMDRFRWIAKTKELTKIIAQLQMHKSSLTLMMVILTSQSSLQVENSVDKLCDLVDTLLKENRELARRLKSAEPGTTVVISSSDTLKTKGEDVGDVRIANSQVKDDLASIRDVDRSSRGFAFEELLSNSRAYRMASRHNEDSFSILSSAGRTGSWSMLSGMSLSEMSNVALLALPIYAGDLANRDKYNFEPLTSEPSIEAVLPVSLTKAESASKRNRISNLFSRMDKSSQILPRTEILPETDGQPTVKIFGVSLDGIPDVAKVAITLRNDKGEDFTYGYIPTVVAKCCWEIKQNGCENEDILARSGHPQRILSLQKWFESPPRYGNVKRNSMSAYTSYDVAGVLLRFLKSLPESVIPVSHYERFVSILRPYTKGDSWNVNAIGEAEVDKVFALYQKEIIALPLPNLHLLIYIIDFLAVVVWNPMSAKNLMSTDRVVAALQPSLLWSPEASETQLAHNTMIFLLNNQDSFYFFDEGRIKHEGSAEQRMKMIYDGNLGVFVAPASRTVPATEDIENVGGTQRP